MRVFAGHREREARAAARRRAARARGRAGARSARRATRASPTRATARKASGSASSSTRTSTGSMLPRERFEPEFGLQWLGWGAALLVLALVGAWLIASRIARPLAALDPRRRAPRARRAAPAARRGRPARDAHASRRVQPHGERPRQHGARARHGARRHLARPAHAALAPAPRARDERRRGRRGARAWPPTSRRWTQVIGQFLDFARGEDEEHKTARICDDLLRGDRGPLLALGRNVR